MSCFRITTAAHTRSNRIAHWAVEELGVTPGATVALLMTNTIEYVALWFVRAP
jgi:acyl-CoA synthetase (AMP-forming)/AMP-acid ligase II